jgi:hypothetical protein
MMNANKESLKVTTMMEEHETFFLSFFFFIQQLNNAWRLPFSYITSHTIMCCHLSERNEEVGGDGEHFWEVSVS